MKTAVCECGSKTYFGNFKCLRCGSLLGRCDACGDATSFDPQGPDTHECTNAGCNLVMVPCGNRGNSVCNSMVPKGGREICQLCQFTAVAPDLSKPKNLQRWRELERAKRQLLVQLRELDLPPYKNDVQAEYPLKFEFRENSVAENGEQQIVYTGHANGTITINIKEADSVYREKTRIHLNEPQRTLIGHMRHEVGHYIDWCFARPHHLQAYTELFGDPNSDYVAAKDRYYEVGAPEDWPTQYVSAYATMHPCEDFAETVNVYLDLLAVAGTANEQLSASIDFSPSASGAKMVSKTLGVAIAVSEFNRDMGLPALLPEQLPPAAIQKIEFVHSLRSL